MSRQLNPAQIWSQVPVASRTVTSIRTLIDVTSTLDGYNTNNPINETSTSVATGVVSAAKSVISPLGQYDNQQLAINGAATLSSTVGAWEWTSTSVRVRNAVSGSKRTQAVSGHTTYYNATVVEYF